MRQLRDDSIMGTSKQFTVKNLHILYGRKERCEFYRNINNKTILSMIYAEYFHTLIELYYNTKYCLHNKEICNTLHTEFCKIYDEVKGKIKFDKKKTLGYFSFRYFSKLTISAMHIARIK